MPSQPCRFRTLLAAAVIAAGSPAMSREAAAQVSGTATLSGTSYTQNFDAMTTGSNSVLPTGWQFGASGTANWSTATNTGTTTQNAGTAGTGVFSSSSGGGAYLMVSGTLATGTDKAIGFLTSAGFTSPKSILFGFTNTTGSTITDLDLAWDYEKYRSGQRATAWTFFSSSDGSTWTARTAGDQSYAANANNTTVSNPPTSNAETVSIGSLSIANNADYYFRWVYTGNAGSNNTQALAVDNFTLNATVPEPGGVALAGIGIATAAWALRRRSQRQR